VKPIPQNQPLLEDAGEFSFATSKATMSRPAWRTAILTETNCGAVRPRCLTIPSLRFL
jgi:hypothetical protein